MKPVAAVGIGTCLVETSSRQSRKAWIRARGPIPSGMQVLHHCDNELCRRIDHLYLGTAQQNTGDMIARGRAWFQRKPPKPEHIEIFRRYMNGEGRVALAVEYGMYPESISRIIRTVNRHAR